MNAISAITKYRTARGLSQEEFAESLGVSRPTVNRWERGARKIGSKFVPAISQRTGIPVSDLRPDLFPEVERA